MLTREFVISILNRIGLIFLGYIVAYMQWSLILPLVTVGTLVWLENKTNNTSAKIKSKSIASTLGKEELVHLLNNKLPSWVTFPDRERAEWVNEFILTMWPNISNFIIKKFRTKLQNSIRKKIDSFRFEEIDFGEIPPKIDGVKIYTKRKDCIIIDFDIFYDGDCDIHFGMSGKELGRIRNFQLGAEVRIILKPLLVKMPLVGGMQIFFLNDPDINFEIVGFSKLPGLNYVVRQAIEKRIRKKIVFPNNITKKFSKTIEASELRSLEPEGILRVHVFEARDLEKKDKLGKSDPYVILSVGAQQFQTPTIKKTLNPKWDYWCEFIILDPLANILNFYVWDEDDLNEDDFLGGGGTEIHSVLKKDHNDKWFKLEKAKHGEIHLRFTWLGLSTVYGDLHAMRKETELLKVTNLAQSLLTFYVDSARNLPKSKTFTKPHGYFKVILNDKVVYKSKSKSHNSDPFWEEGTSVLVHDPEKENVLIEVWDKRSESKLGFFEYSLTNLTHQPNMHISKEVFPLVVDDPDSSETQIVLSLQLRILTNALFEGDLESDSDSDDDIKPPSQHSCSPTESSLFEKISTDSSVSDSSKPMTIEETLSSTSLSRVATTPSPPNKVKRILSMSTPKTMRRSLSKKIPCNYGRIELTLDYNMQRQRLVVKVHQIENLTLTDPEDLPDPYVKLKLSVPGQSQIKNKTKVIINCCNPTYEEAFDYIVPERDVAGCKLVITVKTKKWFNSPVLGQTAINLNGYLEKTPNNFWLDFGPEEESD
ncbi:extended synaptotagmin-2 isoform X2 [Aethina tumida]|nr:extended synaptotagmin-2 isoform X2 [Aethina tumida]